MKQSPSSCRPCPNKVNYKLLSNKSMSLNKQSKPMTRQPLVKATHNPATWPLQRCCSACRSSSCLNSAPDRTIAVGSSVTAPKAETVGIQSVSVSELTDTTQDAIAMAVKLNGTASNEVDIIVAATSILKSRASSTHETPGVISPTTHIQTSNAVPPSRIASAFPPSGLSTLTEYV